MAERHRYALGGFVIHSTWRLPELASTEADDGILGRIRLEHGTLPDRIASDTPDADVSFSACELLLRITGVGGLWVRDGNCIVAAVADGVDEADLRPFILGSGIGAICHQRGLIPLHGSAVSAGGRTAVFLGPQGAGKSTLLASLMRAGLAPFSDDLTIVAVPDNAPPIAFAGAARVKLWPDSAAALGFHEQELELSFTAKLQIPLSYDIPATNELGALYLLEERDDAEPPVRIERLSGDSAVSALAPQLYRPQWLAPGTPTLQGVVTLKRLALAVPVFRLQRVKRMERALLVAERVAHHITQADR